MLRAVMLSAALAVLFANMHAAPSSAQEKSKATGFVPLFNGKDLTGWNALPADNARWEVVDGVLRGTGGTGHLYSERKDYKDIHLRAEARINDRGNSGIYVRATPKHGFPPGYEAQINSTHVDSVKTGSLHPAFDRSLPIEAVQQMVVKQMLVKPGDWFTHEVIARGNRITIKVNGKTTVDYVDRANRFEKGCIALQQHHKGSVVEFKRIEVKELANEAK